MDGAASPTGADERRYEFRVWGDDLAPTAELIRSEGEPLDPEKRRETYLVTAWSDAINVKVRLGELDVKTRAAITDGFERWQVRHKSEFPIDAGTLRREIFIRLGLSTPAMARSLYSEAQLITELVTAQPHLIAVDVTKERRRYEIGAVMAEVTAIQLDGVEVASIAIESTRLAALGGLRRRLGLVGSENTAYPLAIRRLLPERFADT